MVIGMCFTSRRRSSPPGRKRKETGSLAHCNWLRSWGAKTVTLPGYSVVESVLSTPQHNVPRSSPAKPARRALARMLPWLDRRPDHPSGHAHRRVCGHSNPLRQTCQPNSRRATAASPVAALRRKRSLGHRWAQRSARRCILLLSCNLVMIYLLVVFVTAIYLGAAVASCRHAKRSGIRFLLVPPHLTLAVADTEYLLTFSGLLVGELVIIGLTVRVREQANAARHREAQTASCMRSAASWPGPQG